jgi:hypothetical protein
VNERQQQVAWLRTRATVLTLMHDALDAASKDKTESVLSSSQKPATRVDKPRPLMILPPSPRLQRLLLAGRVLRRP